MRKLAYVAIFLLIALVILITLGATNYAGVGDTLGGFMHTSLIAPVRNFIVGTWLFIGTSGWYILAAVVGIGLFWIPFYFIVIKGLFWNKLIQEKLLHKAAESAPLYQSAPSAVIPVTELQSRPTQSVAQEPVKTEQKTES